MKHHRIRSFTPYFFLLPSGILFLCFTLIPIGIGFLLSFFKWDVVSAPRFNGVENWMELFQDEVFRNSILTTLKFVVINVPVSIVLGILIAHLVNTVAVGKSIYRSIFFAPVVTSAVAVSFVMKAMFSSETGIVNYFLGQLGIQGPNWTSNEAAAVIMCVMFITWGGLGTNMLIFLSGFQGIPESLYEAAKIDGSSNRNTFFRITLPILTPSIFFVLVTTVMGSFQIFDQIYMLTKGGPGYATTTMVYTIYKSAYTEFRMGYASTVSLVLFVLIMAVTALQWKYQERWVVYD